MTSNIKRSSIQLKSIKENHLSGKLEINEQNSIKKDHFFSQENEDEFLAFQRVYREILLIQMNIENNEKFFFLKKLKI